MRSALREIDDLVEGYWNRVSGAARETVQDVERRYSAPDEDPEERTLRAMNISAIATDVRGRGTTVERSRLVADEVRRALDRGDPMTARDLLSQAERMRVEVDLATRSVVTEAYERMDHRQARAEAISQVETFIAEERAGLARTRANAHAASGPSDDALLAGIDAKLADHAVGRPSRA